MAAKRTGGQIARSTTQMAAMAVPPYPTSSRQYQRLLARADCPFESNVPRHPIDMREFRAWYDANVAPNKPGGVVGLGGGETSARSKVELQLKLEQTLLTRKRRELLDQRYVRREESERRMGEYVVFVRGKLEEAVEAGPVQIDGLDPEQVAAVRAWLRNWYDEFCREMEAVATVGGGGGEGTRGREGIHAPAAAERADPKKVKAANKRHRE